MIPDKLQLCDDEDKGQVFTISQSQPFSISKTVFSVYDFCLMDVVTWNVNLFMGTYKYWKCWPDWKILQYMSWIMPLVFHSLLAELEEATVVVVQELPRHIWGPGYKEACRSFIQMWQDHGYFVAECPDSQIAVCTPTEIYMSYKRSIWMPRRVRGQIDNIIKPAVHIINRGRNAAASLRNDVGVAACGSASVLAYFHQQPAFPGVVFDDSKCGPSRSGRKAKSSETWDCAGMTRESIPFCYRLRRRVSGLTTAQVNPMGWRVGCPPT